MKPPKDPGNLEQESCAIVTTVSNLVDWQQALARRLRAYADRFHSEHARRLITRMATERERFARDLLDVTEVQESQVINTSHRSADEDSVRMRESGRKDQELIRDVSLENTDLLHLYDHALRVTIGHPANQVLTHQKHRLYEDRLALESLQR